REVREHLHPRVGGDPGRGAAGGGRGPDVAGVGVGHPVPIDGGEAEQLGLGNGGGRDEERGEEGATGGERETAREGATGHGASGPGRVNRDGGGGARGSGARATNVRDSGVGWF